MLPFLYQVKRTSIDGVITILGWRDTLNPATPPTWWLGSPGLGLGVKRFRILRPTSSLTIQELSRPGTSGSEERPHNWPTLYKHRGLCRLALKAAIRRPTLAIARFSATSLNSVTSRLSTS